MTFDRFMQLVSKILNYRNRSLNPLTHQLHGLTGEWGR